MSLLKKVSILLIIVFLIFRGYSDNVSAADLDNTYVRLDRTKANTAPGQILIVAKTTSAQAETGVKVRIGTAWTISSTYSDFTVSTDNLPTGISAWPGINTATSVNGQTISFPSNDLTADESFGFYLTGGIGTNPSAGVGMGYVWRIATLVNSNEDSTMEINVPVFSNDQITLTGTVPANPSDYQAELTSSLTGTAQQNETINYQITYGSYSLAPTKPLVITAEWSRGTIEGFPVPSLDIVDYVIGSGNTAYNATEPVIDLVNRQLVWTINNFPANTVNQTTSFSLKTNDSYTGSSNVNFDVTLSITAGNIAVASEEVNQTYQYNPPPTPTPTITPTPTTTPSPGPTSTPTPTPATTSTPSPSPTSVPGPTSTPGPASTSTPGPTSTSTPTPIRMALAIEKVEIAEISTSQIKIRVKTNRAPAEVKVSYGKSLHNLKDSVINLDKSVVTTLTIDGLNPESDYYFRVFVKDENNNIFRSDLFTFKTAAVSVGPKVVKDTILIASQDKIIYKVPPQPETPSPDQRLIIIPKNQKYTLQFAVNQPDKLKSVSVLVKKRQVLGINSIYGFESTEYSLDLIQIRDREFMEQLISPKETGFYDLISRLEDFKGNIVEENIGVLEVVNPLTIYSQQTNQPIEAAKVFLSLYNQQTNLYRPIPPSSLAIKNPSYSEPNGEVPLVLPVGKYQAEISADEYLSQKLVFTISEGGDQKYPQVYLKPKPPSFFTILKFYWSTLVDVFNFGKYNWGELASSLRFFRLVSKINLLISLVLLILINRRKNHPNKLPSFLIKNWLIREALEIFLGSLSTIMVVFALSFVRNHGWPRAGWWFILAIINLIWWLVYTYENDKKNLKRR